MSYTTAAEMPRSKWLTKGGLSREDSDDELGYDDIPWKWVYDDNGKAPKKSKAGDQGTGRNDKNIVGAEMGSFSVKIGDAILLKSPEKGKDWAALICSFSNTDDDGEEDMCANVQWFCSPEELSLTAPSKKPRPETLPNESFITTDFNLNSLSAINGKASIVGQDEFFRLYPGGKAPKGKAAQTKYAKTIMCRRGVKQRSLIFSEEFVWEDMYRSEDDLLGLIDWITQHTKLRRKTAEDKDYQLKRERDDEDLGPQTPKKKQKLSHGAGTPKSTTKKSIFITPTHKRIAVKKALEITPLSTRILSPSQYMSSPYSQARTTLHVSAVPTSLPCRSNEFTKVYAHLQSAISDGSGACIYISGIPGTGKTATVREVVASLHQAVLDDELDDFNFVEINGMKVTEPHQSYSLLWEALKGDRVSPTHALSLLEHEFSHPSPRRIPCVVLMDELDQLVTKNQSVMYNFFNWPALRHSRLIVFAVANTMDLPERTLSNKISSRVGLTRITFPGYTHQQLIEIITSRLEGVPGNIVDADAIQFASRKVAAVSGDARRALDICRRAVEIAEQTEDAKPSSGDTEASTPSKRGRGRPPAVPKEQVLTRVSIATIKQAINEATSSPMAQHLKSLPLASKLFLAALLARSRRTGVAESSLGEVLVEAKRIADVAENAAIHDFLLVDRKIDGSETLVPRVLAMGAAAMELVEAGIVAMEARHRGERAGRIRLRVGDDEVKSSLMNDPEVQGMGFSA